MSSKAGARAWNATGGDGAEDEFVSSALDGLHRYRHHPRARQTNVGSPTSDLAAAVADRFGPVGRRLREDFRMALEMADGKLDQVPALLTGPYRDILADARAGRAVVRLLRGRHGGSARKLQIVAELWREKSEANEPEVSWVVGRSHARLVRVLEYAIDASFSSVAFDHLCAVQSEGPLNVYVRSLEWVIEQNRDDVGCWPDPERTGGDDLQQQVDAWIRIRYADGWDRVVATILEDHDLSGTEPWLRTTYLTYGYLKHFYRGQHSNAYLRQATVRYFQHLSEGMLAKWRIEGILHPAKYTSENPDVKAMRRLFQRIADRAKFPDWEDQWPDAQSL